MPSDAIQFRGAMEKWERMRESSRLSVPRDIGKTAIIFSRFSLFTDSDANRREVAAFANEAERFQHNLSTLGRQTKVIEGITYDSLTEEVLTDKSVSDTIVIANGSLSYVYGDDAKTIDWQTVAVQSDHLKQGYFVQRFCGHYIRRLSVPFGTFAVTDHRNVYAPLGKYFAPEINPRDEDLLEPVTDRAQLSIQHIKNSFPYK